MDRLEEIRQKAEAGGPIRRIDMKYLLSEVDRLNALHKREIIVTGEYAQRVIDLAARAEAAEAERDAAVEDLKLALIDETLDPCHCCEYGRTNHCTHPDGPTCGETDGKNWQWRGQQNEKGE